MNEEERLKHPNYRIAELSKDELHIELSLWKRKDLIDWLCWNDSNGIYRDDEALPETGSIVTKKHAIEIITRQIFE